MSKKHVYCIPGMGASHRIFERIKLPSPIELHVLEWKIPYKDETLSDYALRFVKEIKHEKPILLGVSFGAIVAQEIAKLIDYEKILIISSIKSDKEFPWWIPLARKTFIYKLLPTRFVEKDDFLKRIPFLKNVASKRKLYDQFIHIKSKIYYKWAIEQIINWKQSHPPKRSIHIHGDKDCIFPIKNIKNKMVIKNGTHIMIIHRFRWFNENLPQLIIYENN